jgi:Protein of unknown function (DUF4242)
VRDRVQSGLGSSEKGLTVKTYVIRRGRGWASPRELERTAGRSVAVADSDFPGEINWIRSYVIAEDGGAVGTVCIYQASSPEEIRKHAREVGMPADEILEVADVVVHRPDPATAS